MIDEAILPVWVAVLIAAFTGSFFTCHQLLVKHLCQPRIGFNVETLTFSSYMTSSVLVSICSIPWFMQNEAQTELFYYGLGTIVTSIGTICMSLGINKGPGGPAIALSSLDGPIYSIIYAFIYQQMLSTMEICGLIIGVYGVFAIMMPKCALPCLKSEEVKT